MTRLNREGALSVLASAQELPGKGPGVTVDARKQASLGDPTMLASVNAGGPFPAVKREMPKRCPPLEVEHADGQYGCGEPVETRKDGTLLRLANRAGSALTGTARFPWGAR